MNEQTILVVDDEPLNRKLLRIHLADTGYRIVEAESGEEALVRAKEGVDLVLLDIMMPGMDGLETFVRLKKSESMEDIPVIFLSAIGDSDTKVACLKLGGADYITKPFVVQEVLARVKTHLTLRERELLLREYSKKMEQKVEERTRQLIHSDRLATLGMFSAGLAHEIRNPLTGINTHLYNLQELCKAEEGHGPDVLNMITGIASQVQEASSRIELIIKRMLEFSKPVVPKMGHVDLSRSVVDAIKIAEVTLRKQGITLTFSMGKDIPKLYADPVLIQQVILNLIQNSANAMEHAESPKKVEVECTATSSRVSIRVSDSGPGIPEEIREKIFHPFFTTHEDGYGLGLSIVEKVIEDHCGKIIVGTSPLGGAEFRIELPVEKRRMS